MTLTESTILTGGSNNSQVTGSTNVFISGTAKLWDVQGGGRRGVSGVGTANVEVSGQAAIRHVLCGSITDGLERNGTATPNIDSYDGSVKDVNITIEDNVWLASNVVVCGGVTIGHDTVIGAGSVVTRDIPAGVLAAGNPCRVIRPLGEKDKMKLPCE